MLMGKTFIERLRNGTLAAPTSPKFDPNAWKAELDTGVSSSDDCQVFLIGLQIKRSLDAVRKHLTFVTSNEVPVYWRRRGLVALVNHQALVANMKATAMADERKPSQPNPAMDLLANTKIELPLGNFSPDAIIESAIDTGGRLLRMIASAPASEEISEPALSFKAMTNDLNVGIAYAALEGLWLDVLWNDFRMSGDESYPLFASVEGVREEQRAESQFRHLMTSIHSEVIPYVRALATNANPSQASIPLDMQATIVSGQFILTPVSSATDALARRVVLETSTLPIYYQSVVNTPGPQYKRLTLVSVTRGYALLRSIAESASAHATEVLERAELDPSAKASEADFAPVVNRDHLRMALASALAVGSDVAEEMISFFTGAGQGVTRSLDHWMAPLVSLTSTSLTMFPQAVRHASLRRLADLWLRHLGFDLDIRGLPFEAHVRTSVRNKSLRSSLAGLTQVLSSEFILHPDGSREEQIDLVVVLGDRVLIGEVKCFLQPSSPLDRHNHWDKLCEAVAQVTRKAKAVQDFETAFRSRAQHYGLTLPVTIEVLPLVVLNHAIDVGHVINGVPVVDLRILEMFFEGVLQRNAIVTSGGRVESSQLEYFYRSAAEATEALADYLNDPPQLRHLHGTVVLTEQDVVLATTTGRARVGRHEVCTDRFAAPLVGQPP